MRSDLNCINNETAVLNAAQSVWAVNKYLMLAYGQQYYQEIRRLLKLPEPEFVSAYNIFVQANHQYQHTAIDKLPELKNALYHIAGYFKTYLTDRERQDMHLLIQDNPSQALMKLESYTYKYDVAYLKKSRIWEGNRQLPFNLVPVPIKVGGIKFKPKELFWMGDYLTDKINE